MRRRIAGAIKTPDGSEAPADAFGVRVWLLPRLYYWMLARERRTSTAWLELASATTGRPRIIRAASLGNSPPSGNRWTVGKGLPSHAIFSEDPDRAKVIVHHRDWPSNAAVATRRDVANLPREVRLGRSHDDFRRLSGLYSSAVAVALRHESTSRAFGCMTVDTGPDFVMDDRALETCETLMFEWVDTIIAALANDDAKGLPKAVRIHF